jgi:hypothetical protein
MRVIALLVLIACEQHRPAPVRHAEPPPPPPPAEDAGVSVAAVADATAFVRGATYCPGATTWPAGQRTCTTDGDCPHGRCYPGGVPDYSGMCGMAPREIAECSRDRDCGAHRYCDHPYERHGCGEVVTARCMPACTASSCKAGEICRPNGRCEIEQCTDGYACRAGWKCEKAGYIHDEHGCAQPACTATSCGPNMRCAGPYCDAKTCTKTADCDCGACMAGRCSPRPGVCGPEEEPQPPP